MVVLYDDQEGCTHTGSAPAHTVCFTDANRVLVSAAQCRAHWRVVLAWPCVIGALELLQKSSMCGGLLGVLFVLRLQLAMHGFALADRPKHPHSDLRGQVCSVQICRFGVGMHTLSKSWMLSYPQIHLWITLINQPKI